ncbi:Zinc finger BED domain-containing protein 1 [Merluccius polli]|uniref:Zinc finger BED domain-containing protein 1 n=1 Tax=Merluccius polli TaxID=89951 RepID=A0AA47M0N9_MERPO|nr:Zinc finger BED domain-containing protein 1 [Merluccius polli]
MKEKNILHISSALDPRFKSLQFLLPQDVQDTNAKLMEMAAALKEDAEMDESQVSPAPTDDKEGSTERQTPETNAHTPKKKRKSALADLLGQTFKTTHHQLSATSIAETVKQYLDAPPLPLTDEPLHWWKSHAQAYPLLAKLAQRHLCVPGTSVPVERVFSTASDSQLSEELSHL